jgi:tetratricopeptide (TPR) repeat protein
MAVVETEDWMGTAAAMKVDVTSQSPWAKGYDAFTTGYAAAMRGDKGLAASSLATVRAMAEEDKKAADADPEDVEDLGLVAAELNSLVTAQGGDLQNAIAQAQAAATTYHGMAFDFGPPATGKPPDELLGELLLQAKRAPEAHKAFAASLESAPRRTESLLGLARAENAMGDEKAALESYGELLKIWKNADAGYAPKAEAEGYVAAHSGHAQSTAAPADSIAAAVFPLRAARADRRRG